MKKNIQNGILVQVMLRSPVTETKFQYYKQLTYSKKSATLENGQDKENQRYLLVLLMVLENLRRLKKKAPWLEKRRRNCGERQCPEVWAVSLGSCNEEGSWRAQELDLPVPSPTGRLWMIANHYRRPHVNHRHFCYNTSYTNSTNLCPRWFMNFKLYLCPLKVQTVQRCSQWSECTKIL